MNQLLEIISREIRKSTVLSFARFMELALYCPVYGFYEKEGDTVGRRGDFITNVSVGSLFGELLAFQFAEWLQGLETARRPLQIVEAGTHRGTLARDILSWLAQHRPQLFSEAEYVIVEPAPRRRQWQEKELRAFGNNLRWVAGLQELATEGVQGILFSNELLDAMPVHRLGWDAAKGAWFEWGVGLQDGKPVWTRMNPTLESRSPRPKAKSPKPASRTTPLASQIPLPQLPQALLDVLPDGFMTEVSPAAERWWSEAARALRRGKLLTIDYGLQAEEFFSPALREGTLRSYSRHQVSKDVLANPGGQDLTAHVNFTAIAAAGTAAGLETAALTTQEQFLTQVAAKFLNEQNRSSPWNPGQNRQFQTLTHPDHFGSRFCVLVQTRP